jgi:hypothetical protein
MQRILPLIVPALLLLAGGCVRTTQPILNDDQLVTDNSVLGKWVTNEGKDSVEIRQRGEEKAYRIVYSDQENKKGVFIARLGKVGNLTVAELSADDPAPDASGAYKSLILPLYTFMVVDQTQPRLVLTSMSLEWLRKYVAAHPNELQVMNASGDSPIVTAPTADFQAFLLRHWKDEGAATQSTTFARPDDPTTRQAAPAQ